MSRTLVAAWLTLAVAATASARTPAVVADPREGVWVAGGEVFVHQSRDRWSVFQAPATVNEIAVDEETVWVATDDGVVRFESGSRRISTLGMDDGLPSLAVTAVAVDPTFVWFATNKGLVRYRKLDRTLRVYTADDGLPHRAVNDLLTVGPRLWVATRAGLALYDPEVDGLRAFTAEDGLGADYVEELYRVGDDVWARTEVGLSRLQPNNRRFTNFSFEDIGGSEIRVFLPDGEQIWVGTENGLSMFLATSDAFAAFPQQAALEGPSIRGVEAFTDYLFITTDVEVVQYHKPNRSFRRFTAEDGMRREAGALGSVLSGSQFTLVFEDGAETYDIQREVWVSRSLAATESSDDSGGVSWQSWIKADSEVPYELRAALPSEAAFTGRAWRASEERFATLEGGVGAGYQFDDGRSLDVSLRLDYGEVELSGIREFDVKAEYLATPEHIIREIAASDEFEVRTLEEGVDAPFLMMGLHTRLASPGEEPGMTATIDAGVRRGISQRDFLTGERQDIYQLSQRYILPASERVYLDGEVLTAGIDYTVIYPAGQLAFLDPERVDDLSIIEVEYEYDVVPKKGLGVISLLDLLPADNEVGSWTRASEPTVVSEEGGLYAQINGDAPKYIDRGWVRSVYVEYLQGSRMLRLAIHDMGGELQASDIYNYDLPAAREPFAGRDNIILDIGQASSYEVKAMSGSYYIELSVDEKSDPAKQSIKLFAIQVLERGDTAGAHSVDDFREAIASARLSVSPLSGFELGGRVVQLYGLDDPEVSAQARRPRRQLQGILDGRYEAALGQGGRLTTYAEGSASHVQQGGGPDGIAGVGRLRLSHPWVEGSVSARYHGQGFQPIGSDATLYGRMRDEARLNATAYPVRFLPTTVFFSRQGSKVQGTDRAGLVQHALARVQLAHADAPATSVQVGHTLLDDAVGGETNRLKVVGQTDYDLAAGVLKPLGLRRFILRGLYSYADATSVNDGIYTAGDRVQVSRVEAKLAPTSTETAYGLFRWRAAEGRARPDDEFRLRGRHWELNTGARSSIIPGLIPQVNHAVIFDHLRLAAGPSRNANSTVSGQLGIYPGDWWAPLTPIAVDARYSLANEDVSEAGVRTTARRLHRFDNRMSYNGMSHLTVEFQEIYEVSTTGREREVDGVRLELRNRVIVRPTHASPIQLRLDYVSARTPNDRTVDLTASRFGLLEVWEGSAEWLMRWNRRLTTKLKGTYTRGETRHSLEVDAAAGTGVMRSNVQHQVRPELELRLLLQDDDGSFFLVQRNVGSRTFAEGDGASEAWGADVSLGLIWSVADNLYLDGEVAYRHVTCLRQPCASVQMIEPRLLLTAKL